MVLVPSPFSTGAPASALSIVTVGASAQASASCGCPLLVITAPLRNPVPPSPGSTVQSAAVAGIPAGTDATTVTRYTCEVEAPMAWPVTMLVVPCPSHAGLVEIDPGLVLATVADDTVMPAPNRSSSDRS